MREAIYVAVAGLNPNRIASAIETDGHACAAMPGMVLEPKQNRISD